MFYLYYNHMYVHYLFQKAEKGQLQEKYKQKLSFVIAELREDKDELHTLYSMSNTLKNIATCSQEKLQSKEDIKTEVKKFWLSY